MADQSATIVVSSEVAGILVLGLVLVRGVSVAPAGAALEAELTAAEAAARERYGRGQWAEIPGLRDVRGSYHRLGVDPTKRRPSSEALLRRVVGGNPLPRISNLVDCINLFSLRELAPIGLYDAAHVAGAIVFRHGRAGEPYDAIGREAFGITGRPVLADDRGPFGSPTSDSQRTMVTERTRDALGVLFWPQDRPGLATAIEQLGALVVRHCGGTSTVR